MPDLNEPRRAKALDGRMPNADATGLLDRAFGSASGIRKHGT
jgi:hypothetical protein